MYNKPQDQQKAQFLYLQTDLSQQEIADMLSIDRKTLYNWAREGNWKRAKYVAKYAPPILAEQYYAQLGALNNEIALREERPYPTKEEADIIRKLTISIRHIQGDRKPIIDNIDLFEDLICELRRKDKKQAEMLVPFLDDYIQARVKEGHGLDSTWKTYLKEKGDELEYEEWQRNQNHAKEGRANARKEAAENGNPHLPFKPLPCEHIVLPSLVPRPLDLAANGESNGEMETTQIPARPMPVVINEENDNAELSPKENEEQQGNSFKGAGNAYYTQYLEERYQISKDPHIKRTTTGDHIGITIIKSPSPLLDRDGCLFWAA